MVERTSLTLLSALLFIGVAGCTGLSPTPTNTTGTAATSSTTTTVETIEGTGKTFMHVSKLSEAEEADYDTWTAFQNLSTAKQDAFLKAKNCSCQIESSAFSFGDQDVHRVKYEDDIYLIYVSKR